METSKFYIVGGSILLIVVLIGLLFFGGGRPTNNLSEQGPDGRRRELVVYCAAGIRAPIEEAAKAFEQDTGIPVLLDYGNSGELLGKLKLEKQGNARCDIYIPADDSFVKLARESQLIREVFSLAKSHLVLAVKSGNPKGLKTLHDLQRDDVKFVLCNLDAAAGKMTRKCLLPSGAYGALESKVKAFKPTVTDAANDVKSSQLIDAAILWDATAKQFGLESLDIPELHQAHATIPASVVENSKHPSDALKFLRYLAAPEKGAVSFTKHHYEALPGDSWESIPKLVVFAGGMNREAVKETLAAFEAREGCELRTQFAGCGTLNNAIKASEGNVDVYLTCDASFLEKLKDRFEFPTNLTQSGLSLVVRKAKAQQIRTLEDLAGEGVKIGLGDEKTGALGAVSARILREANVYDAVYKNSVTTFPSAHELLLSIESHDKLDVAIMYDVNLQHLDKSKVVVYPIQMPSAVARQNVAVSKDSRRKKLAERFIVALTSSESKSRFEQAGFQWKFDAGNVNRE